MIVIVLGSVAPAFVIALVVTALMRRWAPRLGLIDEPSGRKAHGRSIPLGGGVAIWLAVVATLGSYLLAAAVLARQSSLPSWIPEIVGEHVAGAIARSGRMWAILAAGTLVMMLGLLDDLRELRWVPRLVVQTVIAAALVASGVRLSLFIAYPWIQAGITILWFLVLVNAFNFLDNMDGLSAGVALLSSALFAAVMLTAGDQPHLFVAAFLLVLVGALGGFLVFNWPPATIFMGDAGSYFIGLMIAAATVVGTFYETGSPRHAIMAPLCVLAVPLYDFASVVSIRLLEGRSPFHPDRSHFSHRLVELGLSRKGAVLTIYLATVATGLGALLLYDVKSVLGAVVILAMVACVLGVIAVLETVGRRNNNRR